jgi:hypothetical protein
LWASNSACLNVHGLFSPFRFFSFLVNMFVPRRSQVTSDNMVTSPAGHTELKKAVLLALLSREHCYIEGPPGVAKTMVAEVAVRR